MAKQGNSIIKATKIRESSKSILFDCEGEHEWFPKSEVTFDEQKEELDAPNWLLRKKFPNENF